MIIIGILQIYRITLHFFKIIYSDYFPTEDFKPSTGWVEFVIKLYPLCFTVFQWCSLISVNEFALINMKYKIIPFTLID